MTQSPVKEAHALRHTLLAAVAFVAMGMTGSAALAQETSSFNSVRFELGAGGVVSPDYEGSSNYSLDPSFTGRLISLKLGSFAIGGGETLGFSIGPSLRFLRDRDAGTDPILAGIAPVDASFELGVSLAYEWENARVFGRARYGVVGHNSFVGELGADAIYRPDSQLTLSVGPRLSFADGDYMDTYFSVPVTAVSLAPFSASGGIKSVGLEAALRYDVNESWAIETSAQWDRLAGDAASSPIVKAGSRDQFLGKINLIRKFDFSF